jgi:quinohemoprotein amine dehydrogenase
MYGANFPSNLNASSIDPGPGLRVERVVRAATDRVTLMVRADSGAQIGARDVFAAGAGLRKALVIYDTISRIRITPVAGMARVGGENFPKGFQQFDATAWNDGADGRPDTSDDVEIGPVPVTWTLEEYGVTYEDDDVKFVGSIDKNGLFTPAADGPNPNRGGNRNNIGDVWVVATHTTAGPRPSTLRARANLIVTVPLYMRWEPWRMER